MAGRLKRLCTPLAAALLLGATSSAAQTVSGVGARDCSAWNFALDKESDVAIDAYVAWSQGFVSAFNWANAAGHAVRIDGPGIINFLAEYCQANPHAPVHEAVRELVRVNAR